MVLEFLGANPGVLTGLALGSMASALLLRPVAWRIARVFKGAFRQRAVCGGLLAVSVSFGAAFVLTVAMFLSRSLGS